MFTPIILPPVPKSVDYGYNEFRSALAAWEQGCIAIINRGHPVQPPPMPLDKDYGYNEFRSALAAWERVCRGGQ
jgi:hypothetical protein